MGLSGLGFGFRICEHPRNLCNTVVALSRREVQIDELCLRVRYAGSCAVSREPSPSSWSAVYVLPTYCDFFCFFFASACFAFNLEWVAIREISLNSWRRKEVKYSV